MRHGGAMKYTEEYLDELRQRGNGSAATPLCTTPASATSGATSTQIHGTTSLACRSKIVPVTHHPRNGRALNPQPRKAWWRRRRRKPSPRRVDLGCPFLWRSPRKPCRGRQRERSGKRENRPLKLCSNRRQGPGQSSTRVLDQPRPAPNRSWLRHVVGRTDDAKGLHTPFSGSPGCSNAIGLEWRTARAFALAGSYKESFNVG